MSSGFTSNVGEARAEVHGAAAEAIGPVVEFLLTEANKQVPHDEGTLERSGRTAVDGLTGSVSYDTPYAVRQHEDMSYKHPGKGKAKWLENTFTREQGRVAKMLATAMRDRVGE